MSLMNVTLFFLIGIGIIFSKPEKGIVSLIISDDSGGTLSRRLILPAILLPILLGYIGLLGIGEQYYAAELGLTLLVMGTVIFFVALILINAYLIGKVDIERRKIAHELKVNQAQLQSILDNTSSMVFIYDLQGNYLLVNKEFQKLVRKSAVEIIGKTTHDIFNKDTADNIVKNGVS